MYINKINDTIDIQDARIQSNLTSAAEGEVLIIDSDKKIIASGFNPQKKINKQFITIAVTDWSNNVATKTVTGVKSDEASQIIQIIPQSLSQEDYLNAGVIATSQSLNSITFSCDTTPTTALNVYICIAEV